ncbi:MAG TPA: carboxypeptidase-like regulatory domain-containing protein [Stellaceae bacterium]|nr:carboxypeptidase-like regulatory domain-containing protein [Stellaceae bacterium]
MKLFLTVALSLTAIALIAHAQQLPPAYPPPPGYYPPPPSPPEMAPPAPAANQMIPPPPDQAMAPSNPPMPDPNQAQPASSSLQPQQQGNVTFVSGGAGDEDRDALKQMESQFNLRLLFAVRGSGDYLANVAVTIADARGNAILDTIADGPIFYAHVPPGRYKLTVSNQGQSQSREVSVGAGGAASQDFYWQS